MYNKIIKNLQNLNTKSEQYDFPIYKSIYRSKTEN